MIEASVARKKSKIISVAGEGTENDDPASILMRRIIDSFAEYERLIIKARTRAALQAKKNRSERVGHVPFGYTLADDRKHLVEDDSEQFILGEIRSLREGGLSLRKIAEQLNRREIVNRGNVWNPMNVKRVAKI